MLYIYLLYSLRRVGTVRRLIPVMTFAMLTACAEPYVHPSAGNHSLPHLRETYVLMEDGYRLPLARWEAIGNTRAMVLALHGLNDYSFAFDNLGQYLAPRGITVMAYDQRGFGKTVGHGFWHGGERMSADLVIITRLLRERYPDVPLYLLGDSMGGAVVLTALASAELDIDGIVLVAPAVWTRDSMPFYQRFGLWLAAHTFPAKLLTGEGLDLKPSDNTEMLRALSRDEMVIKATRVDVLYGISNLMDNAMQVSSETAGNILFLYGQKDEIIPAEPTCELFERLSSGASDSLSAISYEQGYHMLTRDLQAAVVIEDIAEWTTEHQSPRHPGSDMHEYCVKINGTDVGAD